MLAKNWSVIARVLDNCTNMAFTIEISNVSENVKRLHTSPVHNLDNFIQNDESRLTV